MLLGRYYHEDVICSGPVYHSMRIKGNKVVVWSGCVANPVAVRYAWADNPEGANLYNKNGLPASAFRAGDA